MTLLLALACSAGPEEPPPPPRADAGALLAGAGDALANSGVEVLRLGVAPYGGEAEVEAWQPLMEHLGQGLGVPIELKRYGPHGELEEALLRREIHGAQLRPRPYVNLSRRHELQIAVAEVYSGALSYDGYIVTLKDQAVREVGGLEDLAQTPFGFVHPDSCSGFLYPAAMLLQAGLHPLEDLDARFFQDHRDVVAGVQEGRVLAGAVWSDAVSSADPEGPALRVVAKTPPIPSSVWVLHADLPEVVAPAMGAAMAEIATNTPEGRALLAPLDGVHGFLPVEDSHFDTVRELEELLKTAEVSPPLP